MTALESASHQPAPLAPAPQNNFYALIPHCVESGCLLLPGEDGWVLPAYHPEDRYTAQVGPLNSYLREHLGADVTVLRCAHLEVDRTGTTATADALFIMENHNPDWSPPEGSRWVGREELARLPLAHKWVRPHIMEWFREEATGQIPPPRAPWAFKGWLTCITDWAFTELAAQGIRLEGTLGQVKHWDISSVWRIKTNVGDIYFKATPGIFAHEPRMTLGLAHLFPEYIPAPLAVATYPDQGWMLLPNFGGAVMWKPTLEQKEDVLRLLARMQIRSIPRTADLFAVGCLDRRLDKLAAQVAEMSRDDIALAGLTPQEREKLTTLLPSIEATCRHLSSGPVPQTLLHGDFHGGNIAVHDGTYTIFDWTDGCITHPFFDLLTFIDPDKDDYAQLRDAYLEEWTQFAPIEILRHTFEETYRLGGLYHALSYRNINANVEPAMQAELEGAFEYFLRLYLAQQTKD